MEKYKVYLFRHGQTCFNKNKIFTGWKESKLTPLGIKQAKKIALGLKNKRIGVAIETKLSRSKDTLKQVLKYHPECRKIIIDNRMIERSYGDLEGKSHEFIIKKYGVNTFNQWHRGFRTRPPKGESFADVEKRVKSFIKYLRNLVKKEKTNIVISAHGNSIRLFRKIIEKKSEKQAVKWIIPYDKYYTYSF